MDFAHDRLADARPFQMLTTVDQWSRLCPLLSPGFAIRGPGRGEVPRPRGHNNAVSPLDRGGSRDGIHVPGTRGPALSARGVQSDFTRPWKPTDNGHIKSFNGLLRDECVNVKAFVSLADAREEIDAWRCDYHQVRLHTPSGHLTPSEVIIEGQDSQITKAAALLH